MSTKIYVGNMSFNANEDELGELFAEYGNVVSVRIISDRNTYRSKGFGFIEMEDVSSAKAAISALNEKDWMDRKLIVNEARERTDRSQNNYR